MREIKFRGKDKDNKWVYGYFIQYYSFSYDYAVIPTPMIFGVRNGEQFRATIIPETVGQFTGLLDKDGREIYEGDVVKMHQFLFNGHEMEREGVGVVAFNAELAVFTFRNCNHQDIAEIVGDDIGEVEVPICEVHGLHPESFEIIGNIHDNPELLGHSSMEISAIYTTADLELQSRAVRLLDDVREIEEEQ